MLISIFFLFLFPSPSFSAFVAPITKHHHLHSTAPFYTLKLNLKTPPQPTDLLLHVSAALTSVDCTRNYTSTTSRPVPCNSSLCRSLQNKQSHTTNCHASTGRAVAPGGGCKISPHNAFARVDSVALPITNGHNPGQLRVFPKFVFSCSRKSSGFLHGRDKKEVAGIAGLGFSNYSLQAQLSNYTVSTTTTAGGSSSVFALCLSGSPSAPGVAFFDLARPYYFMPGIDVSDDLNYTPLLTRKTKTKHFEEAYFIGIKSININRKRIAINGRTMISTTSPYTVLKRSVYNNLIEAFTKESSIMKLKSAEPIKPFKLCYESEGVSETHLGPNVPRIDLEMQNDVIWRVFGKNSMVRIVEEDLDVWCLAIVDGGVRMNSSMVIGGHQLEDNLLQFDLGTKRLGFTSSLLQHKTMCANFNFTTDNDILF